MKDIPMEQRITVYKHEEQNLVYFGIYNNNSKLDQSSSIAQNYHRAKYLHNNLLADKDDGRGLKSGFMMAIINTEFKGWEVTILDTVFADAEEAAQFKSQLILMNEEAENPMVFVGLEKVYIKGIAKQFGVPSTWTNKWNVSSMKKEKIVDKIKFIVRSMSQEIPETIYGAAYMAAVTPNGVAMRHNFGNYEVDSLINLFRFVRNYIGLDLEKI